MKFEPRLSKQKANYTKRDVVIKGADGKPVFEMKNVEAPETWSDKAVRVTASKYFRKPHGRQETSVKIMLSRVVDTITNSGIEQRYFDNKNGFIFYSELFAILEGQYAAFNSPVYFNVGVEKHPQSSACFILDVEDSMESIFDWIKKEAMIFKHGSGSGVNLSPLRSSREALSSGGNPSGPVSFARAADYSAGEIRSGGTLRRSAKIVFLDDDHPDLMDFIQCKTKEEEKARIMAAAGLDTSIGGVISKTIAYQNSNHSVRLSDYFMRMMMNDEWNYRARTTGEALGKNKKKEIVEALCNAIWECGDPGIQFSDMVEKNNTVKNFGNILGSNPCGEFVSPPNTACNLGSLNLVKFDTPNSFDWSLFKHVIRIMVTAMDILIDMSSYPTKEVTENSRNLRPIGLGFSNLGSLFMRNGIAYDGATDSFNMASEITSRMTAYAYEASIELSKQLGPFPEYEHNKEYVLRWLEARSFDEAYEKLHEEVVINGVRNSQLTLLAPTGTISFMMDCDTTGIEPETSLMKIKYFADGGFQSEVSGAMIEGLKGLGYGPRSIKKAVELVKKDGHLENFVFAHPGDDEIFMCAYAPDTSVKVIDPYAHMKIMKACQEYLHGAISKTVALPCDIKPEMIWEYVIYAWEHGLKSITFFRDGCKTHQPVNTKVDKKIEIPISSRRRLPDNCISSRHRFSINGVKGYIIVSEYDDGTPGEVFVKISKEGSTIGGLMETIATETSIALQYGVPLKTLVDKFSYSRFEPAGFTNNQEIPLATSLVDYLFRYLGMRYLSLSDASDIGLRLQPPPAPQKVQKDDGTIIELCFVCGGPMTRSGTCQYCPQCGASNGCS